MNSIHTLKGMVAAVVLLSSTLHGAQTYGLDQIDTLAYNDERLNKKVASEVIDDGVRSAARMNAMIIEAILQQGLANDGDITAADTREINGYLVKHYTDTWRSLRGEDAGEASTGFYKIERKGAQTEILNTRAIDTVYSNIYNLGLHAYDINKLSRYDGSKGGSFTTVSYYLSELLSEALHAGALANPDYQEVKGTTGSSLDQIVGIILNDHGLNKRIKLGDMREAAKSADAMNALILEAIIKEGLANDQKLSTADARQINLYLVEHHQARWKELHGDDEDGYETGYHYIQNDGGTTRMFAENVFNSLADGIYHLGFKTDKKCQLVNEDGNANKSFEKVAWWLDTLLQEDMATEQLSNSNFQEVFGTTGTVFDRIIPLIYADEGLQERVSTSDLRAAARSADGMNTLILEAIRETGAAEDDVITADEVKALNTYLVSNYYYEWKELHGDDDETYATGFHRIQNNGSHSEAYGKNIINSLADSVYHLGFETPYYYNLVNEDGKKNASFKTVAYWLNRALQDEFKNDTLK